MIAKVLQNNVMLLGEVRSLGETLDEEDLLKIDGEIIRALVNQSIIKVIEDTDDTLLARIEKLEAKVFAPSRRGRPPKVEDKGE